MVLLVISLEAGSLGNEYRWQTYEVVTVIVQIMEMVKKECLSNCLSHFQGNFPRSHSDKSEVILKYYLGGKACVCCEHSVHFCWKSEDNLYNHLGFSLKSQGFFSAFM